MDGKSLVSIRITKEANDALDRMLEMANGDFGGGHINRTELATWIFRDFETNSIIGSLDKLRKDHFDPIVYLDSVLKRAKEVKAGGGRSLDIQEILSSLASSTLPKIPRSKASKREPGGVTSAPLEVKGALAPLGASRP